MAVLTPQEKEVVRNARAPIRDLADGWAVKELHTTPEDMCRQLSDLSGDDFDGE